jgi:hypothetical protein
VIKESIMNQTNDGERVMYAVMELFDEREIDLVLAPDTVALLTRDVKQALAQAGVTPQEVYEIEIVRPFE